jgi:hypothetical protein
MTDEVQSLVEVDSTLAPEVTATPGDQRLPGNRQEAARYQQSGPLLNPFRHDQPALTALGVRAKAA